MKLTTDIARKLELPSGKTDHIYWDDDFPGFGVRVRDGRKRISLNWVYQFDIAGRTRRHTIGNVNAIGIEAARKTAGELQSKRNLGDDPVREKAEKLERAAHTFASVLKNFLEVQKRTTRALTWITTNLLLGEPCKPLYPMSLAAITRRDIANVLTPIVARGTPSAHNNVRNKLVTFFNWAISQGLIENNPAFGTEKQEQEPRTRVLSMPELVAIWHAVEDMTDYPTLIHLMRVIEQRQSEVPRWRWHGGLVTNTTDYAAMIRLMMLTGARRSEIGELRWPEIRTGKTFIDDGLPIAGPAIVLPKERTKNKRKFVMPLSKPAQTILLTRPRDSDDGLVFRRARNDQALYPRAWSRHKKLLDAALIERGHKLEPWVLHDLRRSVATHMGDMGIQPHVIEEVLNHFRKNVYNKSKLEGPKRQAVESWGDCLMAHVEGRKPVDNVVQGQFRA
jgi:integrase